VLLFGMWMRSNLKESPVFEERPDVVDGVALSRKEIEKAEESTLESGLRQRKGKAFLLALGLRFGQAGNSGLVQGRHAHRRDRALVAHRRDAHRLLVDHVRVRVLLTGDPRS
jgi:hypothetical protein